MTYKETEILIQKYLNAETSPEEERQLALEVTRDDAPEEWRIIGEMLGELTTDEALFDQIMKERKAAQKPKRSRKIWPWLVAACIAGIIALILAPPKSESPTPDSHIAEQKKTQKDSSLVTQQTDLTAQITLEKEEHSEQDKVDIRKTAKASNKKEGTCITTEVEKDDDTPLLAEVILPASESKTGIATESKSSSSTENKFDATESKTSSSAENKLDTREAETKVKQSVGRTLTERDIPITRPENLKYTKEELALMKKQANEAYLKWVELELEISKYNLENTAENR